MDDPDYAASDVASSAEPPPKVRVEVHLAFKTLFIILDDEGNLTEYLGSLENLPTGYNKIAHRIHYKVIFDAKDSYKSHLIITVITGKVTDDLEENQDPKHVAQIKLGYNAIANFPLASKSITNIDDLPESMRQVAEVQDELDRGRLHYVRLQVHPHEVVTEGLLNELSLAHPEEISKLRNAFSPEGQPLQLALYLRGGNTVPHEITRLNTRFAAEQATNPLDRWHTAHPRHHFVQLGQITPKKDRPSDWRPPCLAFSSFAEYVTVIGYGVVQEEELASNKIKKLDDVDIPMRVIEVPYAGNRRYIAFLDMQFFNAIKFRPGDRLIINFHFHGTRKNDWHAIVADTLPLAPVGSITIVLHRPKKENKETHEKEYVATPLAALRCAYATDVEARQAIAEFAPLMVKVHSIQSELTMQRQISSLQALQRSTGERHTEFRHLLLGQDARSAFHVDLYGLHPDAAIQTVLNDLQLSVSQRRGIAHLRHLPHGLGLFTGPPGTGKTHFIVQAVKPLLSPKTDGSPSKILILCPG